MPRQGQRVKREQGKREGEIRDDGNTKVSERGRKEQWEEQESRELLLKKAPSLHERDASCEV